MKLKDPATWGEVFLPKNHRVTWTSRRWVLLAFAIAMLIDSFLVPFYGPLDPGGSGAGMLAIILSWRASSKRKLPRSVVVAGGCTAALTLALNHGLLKSPSAVWTTLFILLLIFVLFWGRGKPNDTDEQSQPEPVRADPQSALDVTGRRDSS
jgi:hypothetical protein